MRSPLDSIPRNGVNSRGEVPRPRRLGECSGPHLGGPTGAGGRTDNGEIASPNGGGEGAGEGPADRWAYDYVALLPGRIGAVVHVHRERGLVPGRAPLLEGQLHRGRADAGNWEGINDVRPHDKGARSRLAMRRGPN